MMRAELVAAIDAGNSKIDALLVDTAGNVLGGARGGGFRPQVEGLTVAMAVLDRVMTDLLTGVEGPVRLVSAYLAGADSPEEEEDLEREIRARRWSNDVQVGNDTLALLRVGARDGWGVAVVCGAGINAVGVGPDGRIERFPALGYLTGDWGGGVTLGRESLWLAIRGEDGRGTPTALSRAVAGFFGMARAADVGVAVSGGAIPERHLLDLSPVLFDTAAAGDAVAKALVDRMAGEVVTMAGALVERLGLTDAATPVVLGGGVLTAGHEPLIAAIESGLGERAPRARCVVADVAPVVGAALLGLDTLGAPARVAEAIHVAATQIKIG
jgi:N-acetylglucosamine kinase-like BadF-type ATPase